MTQNCQIAQPIDEFAARIPAGFGMAKRFAPITPLGCILRQHVLDRHRAWMYFDHLFGREIVEFEQHHHPVTRLGPNRVREQLFARIIKKILRQREAFADQI